MASTIHKFFNRKDYKLSIQDTCYRADKLIDKILINIELEK